MTDEEKWNERYATGSKPWDTGFHDANLERALIDHAIPPGKVLDVGCGTGTNAIWLADRGFKVIGVDVATLAIEAARRKLGTARNPKFFVLDFLTTKEIPGSPFDFVFDRGCFHSFPDIPEREAFVHKVRGLLTRNGTWCSLIGSTDGPERESGPPRRSLRDIAEVVEPCFEILDIRTSHFHNDQDTPPRCWVGVFRKRPCSRARNGVSGK